MMHWCALKSFVSRLSPFSIPPDSGPEVSDDDLNFDMMTGGQAESESESGNESGPSSETNGESNSEDTRQITSEDSAEFKSKEESKISPANSQSEFDFISLITLIKPSTKPNHSTPVIHPAADAPLCASCRQLDSTFFNSQCPGCRKVLTDPETKVPQIFAIMRQWVPQTQQCIELFVTEILRRGANVNDRDVLTG